MKTSLLIATEIIKMVSLSFAVLISYQGFIKPNAKANENCRLIGHRVYCEGAGNSNFRSQRVDNKENYEGHDKYGHKFSGSCDDVGSTTYCN